MIGTNLDRMDTSLDLSSYEAVDLKKCNLIEILKLVDGKLIVKNLPDNYQLDCTWRDCDDFASYIVIGVGTTDHYICCPCEEHLGALRELHRAGVPLESHS